MAMSVQMVINILFGYGALMSALFLISAIFAPVMPFIMARILPDRVPLFVWGAGGRIKIVTAKLFGGTLVTKKHGTYRETPNSGYVFRRQICYFAPDNYGSTMPFDYPLVVQTLRERGHILNTFADLEALWKNSETREEIIGLGYGRTLQVKDMQYLFPANDNPFINEAKEATSIAIERTKSGTNYMQWILIIGGIAIVAYIAYALFKNFSTPPMMPPVEVICKYPEYVINQMAQNLTI